MKGNTERVKNAPCEGNIMLCRKVRTMQKGKSLSEKTMNKMRKSVGVGFSKLAIQMKRLGYRPNVKEFSSEWMSMSFGKSSSFSKY